MNPLRLLVDAFVNTFGITRPSPQQERIAGRVILVMLLAVLVALGVAFLLMRAAMMH